MESTRPILGIQHFLAFDFLRNYGLEVQGNCNPSIASFQPNSKTPKTPDVITIQLINTNILIWLIT